MAKTQFATWRKKLDRIYEEQTRDLIFNRHVFEQANQAWKPYLGKHKGGALA